MSVPFYDWTREEKEEYADIRMAQMKLLNEKFKKRHAEVEKDRIEAEANNSSVTSIMRKKEADESNYRSTTDEKHSKPKVKVREWDRGKTSLDLEDWSPPEDQHRKNYWRGRSNSRPMKKRQKEVRKEHWRDRSLESSTESELEDWSPPEDQDRKNYWRGRSNSRPMKERQKDVRKEHWREKSSESST